MTVSRIFIEEKENGSTLRKNYLILHKQNWLSHTSLKEN